MREKREKVATRNSTLIESSDRGATTTRKKNLVARIDFFFSFSSTQHINYMNFITNKSFVHTFFARENKEKKKEKKVIIEVSKSTSQPLFHMLYKIRI